MEPTDAIQPGSISRLLSKIKSGDSAAASKLYQRVLQELLAYAHQRLKTLGVRTVAYDADDLVHDMLPRAIDRLKQGLHEDIKDRNGLWGHLLQAANWEAYRELGRQKTIKRGGAGRTLSLSSGYDNDSSEGLLDQIAGRGDTPADIPSMLAFIEREYLRVSDRERPVLSMMLEGYTDREIADRYVCSVKTIERIKKAIRDRLMKVIGEE